MVNLYGPGDNFDLEDSHVMPAMIRKFIEAGDRGDRSVEIWGTGSASREFLYVEDAGPGAPPRGRAAGWSPTPSTSAPAGRRRSSELAETIQKVLSGFQGEIALDPTKPDGQPGAASTFAGQGAYRLRGRNRASRTGCGRRSSGFARRLEAPPDDRRSAGPGKA